MANPDLRSLAQFVSVFDDPHFSPGHMTVGRTQPDGSMSLPYATRSDDVAAFVACAYDNGWVLPDFDWPTWSATDEARALREDRDVLARASADQLAQLLTVAIREDRFSEGSLLLDFERGLIQAIVRRAAQLLHGG